MILLPLFFCGCSFHGDDYIHLQGNVVIGIALTFGFTIFVLAYSIGHISGGHLNFAVTFAFALLQKISLLKGN